MTKEKPFLSYLPGITFIGLAIICSPVVFSIMLDTSPTVRETALLWFFAASLLALGILFLTYATNKSVVITIWLTLASIAVSAAILEIGLRLILQPDENLLIYRAAPEMPNAFRLKSNLDFTTYIAKTPVTIRTSPGGLRIASESPAVDEEKVRIAFIGDSFTFGLWAQSAEKSFAHRVGDLLGRDEHATFNLGVPGYGIEDSLYHLKHHWDAIDPDIVVLSVYNGNDILDTYLGMGRYSVSPDGLLEFNREIAREKLPAAFRSDGFQLEQWLSEHLYTARAAARVVAAIARSQSAATDPPPASLPDHAMVTSDRFWSLQEYPGFAQEARRHTLARLLELVSYCVADKQRQLLIVAIPYQEQVVIPELFDSPYALGRPQSDFAAFSHANGVPYLDLQPHLSKLYAENKEPLYYHFDGHFNDAGHQATAVSIAQAIRLMMSD
ncbi:MAG: hypothetical protein HKO55_02060 [Gammaproteobacteria bacterium]|nr:hypothetical protein [Gammaproteobacteria bacterium]